jgi:hypothetical protein
MSEQLFYPPKIYTQKIIYFGDHDTIVFGKGGFTAKALKREFNISLLASFLDDDGLKYFIIKGIDERGVNHATIRVQELLLRSMFLKEQSHIVEKERWRTAELQSFVAFPPLPSKISSHIVHTPPKKVSFAPMVECRRVVLYPCELNN